MNKKSLLSLFFVPFCVYAHDLSYLENKIMPDSFEMSIYNTIKVVIANGKQEKDMNMTIYSWNNVIVTVIEDSMAKSRYPDPDTVISFIDETFGIREILIIFNEKHDFYQLNVIRDSVEGFSDYEEDEVKKRREEFKDPEV
jgi:hypothetical protein